MRFRILAILLAAILSAELLALFIYESPFVPKEHPATVWRKKITCRETEMKNFCYCAAENSCPFTEKCDTAEKAGFDVIYSGKDVFK